ncbi:hypothetical protein OHS18_00915 [Amycolatopsis sp. NBC_00355]|uniref:hypothetical protein n=1 Tax=Amycolatopsis sp. NBC_00355 TaxID=2975957 RepID=UPI002E274F61
MCETLLIATPEGQDVMHDNALPEAEDPIGSPVLGPVVPDPDARNQALGGRRVRNDGLGTLTTWPTISLRAG